MKALVFDAHGQPLRETEVPDPTCRADEVVISVCRCGICGSDLHMTEDPATFGLGTGDVIGHEFAGEVLEVGREVTDLKPGDLVAAAPLRGCGACGPCRNGDPAWCDNGMTLIGGGYAEYAALAGRQLRKLPQGISLADGALAEPLAVALHGLMRSGMKPGDRVLVVGAGAIGLAVVYWARRLGAGCVVAADLHEYQRDRAMDLGATGFITSGPDMAQRVAAACGGAPDIVFECVGKVGLIDHCIDLVRPRGTVCVLGLCVGTDRMDSFRAISKEVTMIMSVFFNMHEFANAIDALDAGRFAPQHLVSDTVTLASAPVAFEALKQRTTECKVLIAPGG
ncbi:zinc-dependent alcohol dehydrogenase [Mesobacterium pallidum]|uniref:zinc-dependent alcohol dehydrogenase n=1 Tax=Mesobacterium pallidum TaxID=2872037 RepID=UPI001EE19FB5|nr:alcohol dehydrogenase catalytic domain-containing protein [Mesobacterium pallidum]